MEATAEVKEMRRAHASISKMMLRRLEEELVRLGCEVAGKEGKERSASIRIRPPNCAWWTRVYCRFSNVRLEPRSWVDGRVKTVRWNMHVRTKVLPPGIMVVSIGSDVIVRRHYRAKTYRVQVTPGWKERAAAARGDVIVSDVVEAAPVVMEMARTRQVVMARCSHCGHTTLLGKPWSMMDTDSLVMAASSGKIGCALCKDAGREGHWSCCVLEIDGEECASFQCKPPPAKKTAATLSRMSSAIVGEV